MEYKGIQIVPERDNLFSELGKDLTAKYYDKSGGGVQTAIAKAAYVFSFGDPELAQRMYDYASQHYMFYSSPIFSNAPEGEWMANYWHVYRELMEKGTYLEAEARWQAFHLCWKGEEPKAMPIACFLAHAGDSIREQVDTISEISYLSVAGGGTAVHLSDIRTASDKAPGPIPYGKLYDGVMGYYRQGSTRRGATALYLDISHPDIEEFIRMRTTSGGDPARKIDNRAGVHHGVNITDKFREAVLAGDKWELVCPHSQQVTHTYANARDLWDSLLEIRELTGEPYLWFIDVANEHLPEAQKLKGLRNRGSNLCSEISLATSPFRTAVCCLSSVNLEKWPEWRDTNLVQDMVVFLDNVIEWFLYFAPPELERAYTSAQAERAIGIGAMGWSYYLMRMGIPFESGGLYGASRHNHTIFKTIKAEAVTASRRLAVERGEPFDMSGTGLRNSHLLAIAPNSNSSDLCNTTPSCEPIHANAFTKNTRAGIILLKNKYLEPYVDRALRSGAIESVDAAWKDIIQHGGSVQHVTWLTDDEKKVFKTNAEIDQHHVVDQYGERQEFICQAQSLNVLFVPGTERSYIASVHFKALRDRKVKSMYYFRSGSEGVADTVKAIARKVMSVNQSDEADCISCQA